MENIISTIQGKIELTLLEIEQLKFNSNVLEEQLLDANKRLDKLQKHLDFFKNQDNLSIKLEDYLSPEELADYNPTYQFLFEPDMNIKDWLDWFFEELPFIKDKHLIFTGSKTGKQYSIMELYGTVTTNNSKQQILVNMHEPVLISISNLNLFQLLTVNENTYS